MTGNSVPGLRLIPPGCVIFLLPLLATLLAGAFACDRHDAMGGATTAPSTHPGRKTVASLVPAATDLLLAMGAGDRLVAVSNYDVPRHGVRGLPRVGDYQTTDWEQVRGAATGGDDPPVRPRPRARRAEGADGCPGDPAHQPADRDGERRLPRYGGARRRDRRPRGREGADRPAPRAARRRPARTAGVSRPSVLIVRDARGEEVIGPDTFLDDLVTVAGGRNAAAGLGKRYPTIDRELLRSIDPDVILQLLPDATPQVLDRPARRGKACRR